MNKIKDRKAAISARVKEHYDYLVAAGYDVVFTALQGSQNYGLDEYSDDYCSDVDTKSIILPCLDDFIRAKQPISAVEILENDEHAEVKDIRVMFEMFKKENISYIELLYSDYIVFNPKYEALIKPIFERRDEIATADTAQFLRCIAGMAYEKDKALCHPYPGIIEKIERYGYDGKQLSHCARLLLYITDFSNGRPVAECYKPAEIYKLTLMNYKKQLDENGAEMSVHLHDHPLERGRHNARDRAEQRRLEKVSPRAERHAAPGEKELPRGEGDVLGEVAEHISRFSSRRFPRRARRRPCATAP